MEPLVLGAVAYDPKVVTIWDGFKAWFEARDFAFDYVLYSNYERQVRGHFAGHFDVAWNSPLAWLEAEAVARELGRTVQAIAMRDTDCDLTSLVVTRSDSGIASLDDLRGKTIGVGAADSPQATLIPLIHLAEAGLEPGRDFTVRRFDVLLGKHGDHIGGERDAAKALMRGEVDATCMIDSFHLTAAQEGTLSPGSTRVLAVTEKYDHCNFTVLDGTVLDGPDPRVARFVSLLLSMSYEDASARPLLDLEGLKAWRPGRTEGYGALSRALRRFGTIESFVSELVEQHR